MNKSETLRECLAVIKIGLRSRDRFLYLHFIHYKHFILQAFMLRKYVHDAIGKLNACISH